VRCAMLRKHPPVDPVLSCLSCFRKPSVGVCQVVSNSPDPGIAWPSARFRPPPPQFRVQESSSTCIVQGENIQGGDPHTAAPEQNWGLPSNAMRISLGYDLRSLTSPPAGRTAAARSRSSVHVVDRIPVWCTLHSLHS